MDSAVSVEISPAYEETALELVLRAGFEDRVTRIVGDFVVLSEEVKSADLVVMHSVICCYPDVEGLVGAAAQATARFLVVSYPADMRLTRFVGAVQNAWYRYVRKSLFRFFIHPPARINALAQTGGLILYHQEKRFFAHLAVFERTANQERREKRDDK